MYLNPVSYAHGLLDELEGALRASRDEVVAAVRKELAALRKNQLQFSEQEVKDMSDDGKIALASLRERLAAYDGAGKGAAVKPAENADQGAGESADAAKPAEDADAKGKPRTAKAAAPPEAAVKPPAK
jgi:hypothetical protein